MNLEDIEKMFESGLYKSKMGNGAILEAWAQFQGRKLIAVAKAAKTVNDNIKIGTYLPGCNDLKEALEALEKN